MNPRLDDDLIEVDVVNVNEDGSANAALSLQIANFIEGEAPELLNQLFTHYLEADNGHKLLSKLRELAKFSDSKVNLAASGDKITFYKTFGETSSDGFLAVSNRALVELAQISPAFNDFSYLNLNSNLTEAQLSRVCFHLATMYMRMTVLTCHLESIFSAQDIYTELFKKWLVEENTKIKNTLMSAIFSAIPEANDDELAGEILKQMKDYLASLEDSVNCEVTSDFVEGLLNKLKTAYAQELATSQRASFMRIEEVNAKWSVADQGVFSESGKRMAESQNPDDRRAARKKHAGCTVNFNDVNQTLEFEKGSRVRAKR